MTLIKDGESLVRAYYTSSEVEIPTYDDGFGPLWIMRDSMGIMGIVRAQTWEEAYSIAEDEFFPEADETIAALVKEYGYRREHRKVIRSTVSLPVEERSEYLGAFEKFDEPSDYTDNGRLPEGTFLRWVTIETPDPDAWMENELFCESFGFRPNGPNARDTQGHGIYAKDLNGELLDALTDELKTALGITLEIEYAEDESDDDAEPSEPSDDDITTSDRKRFYQYGKLAFEVRENDNGTYQLSPIGRYDTREYATLNAAIRAFMDHEQFWPNCWFISDHGNAHLMDLSE